MNVQHKMKVKWGSLQRKNVMILSVLLLIPVLIVSIVNFSILYTRNISTIESDLTIESEQKLELMRTQLVSMHMLINKQRLNHIFSTRNLIEADEHETFFAITNELKDSMLSTSFFSNISYYNREAGLVYTSTTVKAVSEFFGQISQPSLTRLPYHRSSLELQAAGFHSLQQKGNHIRSIRVRQADGVDGVLFAIPLELLTDAPPASYLLFIVSDKSLSNIWGGKDGISSLITYNDVPIYSSDNAIREAIFNEEFLDGQEDTISSSGPVYTYSQDGIAVKWMLEKKLIMERQLPIILLETLVTFGVITVSFILVLYFTRKSYEPIQQIIRRLSSPANAAHERMIDEFKYINYAIDDLINSKQTLEESSKELHRERYLYKILVNDLTPESSLYEACLAEGIRVDRRWFACLVMDNTVENNDLFDMLRSNEAKAIEKIDFYSIYIEKNKYLFLIASDWQKEELEVWLSELRANEANVVVSNIVEGVNNIRKAYESVSSFNGTFSDESELSPKYPILELMALQEAIETENHNKLEFSIDMIKQAISCNNESMRGAILMATCTIICRGDLEKAKALISELFIADVETTHLVMDSWKSSLLDQETVERVSRRKIPRNLHNIIKYLNDNYTSPNFSIKYMAAEFGTSPSNLSHQFKKATGQTLSNVLDEMRIQQAEKMLAEGEQINNVAKKLGYSTTPVFTEKFKRLRGVTPSVYRNRYQYEVNDSI